MQDKKAEVPFNREREFRNAFYFLKRLAKSPSMPTYTHGYTAGYADKEPAKKIYDYILFLDQDKKKSFEEKVKQLDNFLENAEIEQRTRPFIGSSLYNSFRTYIKFSIKAIENGLPVQKKRM